MPAVHVRFARPGDLDQLAAQLNRLWPEASAAEHAAELTAILAGNVGTMPLVILVGETSGGVLAGFVEISLRSHADGCDPACPVGYVEGWFIVEEYRRQGFGAQLMAAAEAWARSQGCVEIASDTWIDNEVSQHAHEALGFEVVDRCVHYRKSL